MNKNDLFRIIGDISDDLIVEAGSSAKKVRRIRASKIAAIAAAIVALLGITVFASSVLVKSRSGHTSIIPDYYSIPSRQTLQKDIGIQLNVVDTFSNGYSFKSGNITHNEDYDEDGNVFEKYDGLVCRYERGGNSVHLYVDSSIAGNQMDDIETAETYKGCELKYYSYTNKLVPGNYELTEQDKKDRDSGKYVFSFGSSEVEIIEVQGLGAEYGGLSYSFVSTDNGITKDELIQMAKEVIDNQ